MARYIEAVKERGMGRKCQEATAIVQVRKPPG